MKDGAGVKLTRMFSRYEVPILDPFLMLDVFGSDKPADYMPGFPMHPHRGIDTMTYVQEGYVDHRDSLGNEGIIGPGDVQWMTAGSGVLHEEMPRGSEGRMWGFQLWVNLPMASKMIAPRYRVIGRDSIPSVDLGDGSSAKVIAGRLEGVEGPAKDLMVEVEVLDVRLTPGKGMRHEIPDHVNAFVQVYDGSLKVVDDREVESGRLAILGKGDVLNVVANSEGAKFLLISGKPLRESLAWGGPIVMNTEAELQQAFLEIEKGTFVKKENKGSRPKR